MKHFVKVALGVITMYIIVIATSLYVDNHNTEEVITELDVPVSAAELLHRVVHYCEAYGVPPPPEPYLSYINKTVENDPGDIHEQPKKELGKTGRNNRPELRVQY